jgi:hypothetical protein
MKDTLELIELIVFVSSLFIGVVCVSSQLTNYFVLGL